MGQDERLSALAGASTHEKSPLVETRFDFAVFEVESAMGDSKKPRKYKVFFFGTHELCATPSLRRQSFNFRLFTRGYVTAKEMFPYEPNKEKFSKPLKNRGYQEALQEIEFNPNLERTEEENKEEEYHEDDDDSPDEKVAKN